MDTDRWQKLKEIFNSSVGMDHEERRAYLDEACGDDAELRGRLEALLKADEDTAEDDILVPLPIDELAEYLEIPEASKADWTAALINTRVGRYRIKDLISSGGMGTVFEAEQETPRRTVALKIMNRGIASGTALKRFEYESQILARLTHPGIAQVFEAGRHSMGEGGTIELPYFAMEYIEDARHITTYVREKGLSIRERIRLFLQVCHAVQHGNQRGIIHRDLKPGNILVDKAGQVKIIDFGVARVTESDRRITTFHTEAGQIIGTLQYMSPEQCEGKQHDLDVRSDVYSLGVILYELLLDRKPYDVKDASVIEAARRIREEVPLRPGTVRRKLRGDLDTIVLTALEKDREHRYRSVGALAEDLRRHLDGELILARPAGPITRIVKMARRKPVVTVGVGVGLIALVAFFLYVVLWSYPRILKEQARTTAALAAASSRALEKAEINRFLEEMLSAPHPFKKGRDVKVVEVLDKAADEIEGAFRKQPGVEASLRNTIGWSYLKLGLLEEAETHLRAAVDIQNKIKSPDVVESLMLDSRLAAVLLDRDNPEEAERLVRKAFEGLASRLGLEHPNTLRTMVNLGKILHFQDRLDEAEAILTEALDLYRSTHGDDDAFTLETVSQLAATKKAKGDLAAADTLFSEAYEKQRSTLGLRHPDTVITMGSLAMLRNDQGDYQSAEALFREAIEVRRELQGEDHPSTLALMNNLTITLFRQEKLDEAKTIRKELLRIRRSSMGNRHRDTIATMLNLGITHMNLGEYEEAEAIYQEALGYLRDQEGEKSHVYVSACVNLGILQREQGKLDEAEALFREVIDDFEASYGAKNKFILYAKYSLAIVLHRQGKLEEAEALHLEVLEVRRETVGAEHPDTLNSLYHLGLNHLARNNREETEKIFRGLSQSYRARWGEHRDTLGMINQWAGLLVDMERASEAMPHLAETLGIAERTLDEDDEILGLLHTNLGACHLAINEFEIAETHLLKGYDILESAGGDAASTQRTVMILIRLYATWGKPQEQAAWQDRLE